MEKFTAIVLAGGTGKRMHSHIHKQYLTLAGKPVLYYALKAFEESDITDIILVTGADEEAYCKRKIIDKYHIGKVKSNRAGWRGTISFCICGTLRSGGGGLCADP